MNQTRLEPFGLEIRAQGESSKIETIEITELAKAIDAHYLVLIRGFQEPSRQDLLSFCKRLGKIRQWQSGETRDLKVCEDSQNHLLTNQAISFHWDGVFAFTPTHYIFFYCSAAPDPGTGGETVFCDAPRLLAGATEEQRVRWENISIAYSSESRDPITLPLISKHPVSGVPLIRYFEPEELNSPVTVKVQNLTEQDTATFLEEMRSVLYDPSVCYIHCWKKGDIVMADNYALLHARRAFDAGTDRHLIKINIQ